MDLGRCEKCFCVEQVGGLVHKENYRVPCGLYRLVQGWMVRCSEPFKDSVLSPEAVCVGVLEVWSINNEQRRPHFCF